jgi:hypothetical protein
MDFEELALKGIDPSLGPSVIQPDVKGKEAESAQVEKIRASRFPTPYSAAAN